MKKSKYHLHIGSTAACTNIIMEAKKGLGQRYVKGDMKDCFLFKIQFFSKKLAEYGMDVGTDIIGLVNKNTKLFSKGAINNMTKDCPGGYFLMLKSKIIVPGYRPLISIDYNYN